MTFLDRRDDPDNDLYSLMLATSTDGRASFGPNVRVSDGRYGPGTYGFLGDYTGSVVASGKPIPVWPDAHNDDNDIFAQAVDLTNYDGNGQYANALCTSGQSLG